MLTPLKFKQNFAALPLFFQVFAIACSLMLALAVYGFLIDSFREARVFLYSSLTGLLIFVLINLAVSNRNLKETGVMQLVSLLLLFFLLPLFLAFPTWIILPGISFFDAYIDMVGAFTTTGLPVFENDLLSRPLHFWRALIAWFGGGLMWVAAFVILLPANRGGFDLFSSKSKILKFNRKLTLNERSMTLAKISNKLIPIYIGLTIFLWGLLTSLGTDGYTSLVRALSILSTSGISGPEKVSSDGAGFFGEIIMVIFLLLALSHNTFYTLNKNANLKKMLFDPEIRLGLFIICCITLVLFLKDMSSANSLFDFDKFFKRGLESIWGNFFTTFSFMTTNGYVSSYWGKYSSSLDLSHITVIFLGLCLFGGGLATTAGGVKLLRISILFSTFSNETGKLLYPSSITGINSKLKNLEISVFMAWIFFMLFVVSLAIVTLILAMFGMLFEDALVLAVACLTTTGPIIDLLSLEALSISQLPFFSKLALVVSMVLGRLEILVALSVISSALRRA